MLFLHKLQQWESFQQDLRWWFANAGIDSGLGCLPKRQQPHTRGLPSCAFSATAPRLATSTDADLFAHRFVVNGLPCVFFSFKISTSSSSMNKKALQQGTNLLCEAFISPLAATAAEDDASKERQKKL